MKARDLKNSILQMAVEGKLVPQDPADEPADVLLERIREEKHKLIAEGKAKFPKDGESIIYIGSDGSPYEKRIDAKGRVLSDKCIADEVPFEGLPEGWAWARFQTACFGSFTGPFGSALHKTDYIAGGIPVINPANINTGSIIPTKTVAEETVRRLSGYVLHSGDFIIGRRGEMGRAAIISDVEDGWLCGTGCFFAHTSHLIERLFWELLFASPVIISQLETRAVGTTMKNLNLAILESLVLPIPPLTEQRRIVGRVEELMPIVEEYGKLEDAREALDADLPGQLRKSVLQMAVQGKLVPQDPADEPASALLGRIRKQRAELKAPKGGESVIFTGSDGRRYEKRVDSKGRESGPVCIEDEIPFEIPESWEWARLETLGTIVGGGTPKTEVAEFWSDSVSGIPWITPADMSAQSSTLVSAGSRFISDAGLGKSSAQLLPAGSVLMSSRAPIGYLGIAANPIATNQGFKSVVLTEASLNRWIVCVLEALMDSIVKRASGTTFKEISGTEFGKTLVPLPSMREQARILESCENVLGSITNQ